ncbi:hypothetical protein CJA_3041 [Cellvibrio japonicus Ueda107]|uniref:Uncharacterized protein n=2 Tax=Cellvibrio japonicus TaxID=155077 RepID=B3PD83_CELJU|nr:hypothetical protein CJA_3041 [Cellvibrio japonicus Ueda107]
MSNTLFKPTGNQVVEAIGLERIADVDPRLTRSHYFDSRLLTAKDLNRDQGYLDGRLREIGQALGYGVIDGLGLQIVDDNGVIKVQVTPGLAISQAGRVLELTKSLRLDLTATADITEFNGGAYRRIERALYALVIKYSEEGTDVAEAFPADLVSERRVEFDVMTEGVRLALVRLPQPYGQQSEIALRANLLGEWLGDPTAGGIVGEEAVGLGVLAIASGRLQWLDSELLRQPLRAITRPGDVQADLSRRYDNLLKTLLQQRPLSSLTNDFAATDYFRLLPPVGLLPQAAINPVAGRQGYFPQHFNVWITPVRRSDLEQVRADSMTLPPINLNSREPADIIVVVPLNNADYGRMAQLLEKPANEPGTLPLSLDLLRLRLFPVHNIDTDQATWQQIWDSLASNQTLHYIRRPLRAAETRLSSITLARGVPLPANPPASLPSPADTGLYRDEASIFLREINLYGLTGLRAPQGTEEEEAAMKLRENYDTHVAITRLVAQALILIERQYDSILYRSLWELLTASNVAGGDLPRLIALLQTDEARAKATGTAIAEAVAADEFKLSSALVTAWSDLAGS